MTAGRSGRPWRRTQAQVFAEESHCWLCGIWVNPALPVNDRMARTVDHVIALENGGHPTDRSNARLAHRSCNSSKGARLAKPNEPRSVAW